MLAGMKTSRHPNNSLTIDLLEEVEDLDYHIRDYYMVTIMRPKQVTC